MAIEIYWYERVERAAPEGGDATSFTLGQVVLDVAERDQYDISSQITDHSVGASAQITDHQIRDHDRASVTVYMSESPLSGQDDDASVANVELPSGRTASVVTMPDGSRRTDDAFDALRRLCHEGIEVDVEGLRRPLEGWLIERISSPRRADTSGALVCTISLKEYSVASTEEVDAPSPRVERGRARRDRGRQPATPATIEGHDTGEQSLIGEAIDYELVESL